MLISKNKYKNIIDDYNTTIISIILKLNLKNVIHNSDCK